jgi:hypothetical protein
VFLAIIGPKWVDLLHERAKSGERDYVREEIAASIARGVLIIPVLIEHTPVPRTEVLPEDIRPLVLHQRQMVSFERFGRDVDELISAIRLRSKAGLVTPARLGLAAVALVGIVAATWTGLQFATNSVQQSRSIPATTSSSTVDLTNPDHIIGVWSTEPNMGEIEIRKDGPALYNLINLNPDSRTSAVGEKFGELKFVGSDEEWNYRGRHVWGGTKSTENYWGEQGKLVLRNVGGNEKYMVYLDSVYSGGWRLRRK